MTRFAGIRAVTFDAGGTLLRPWPSVGHIYAAVAAEHGHLALDPDTLNHQFADAWQRKSNFDHSPAAWRALVRQAFAGLLDTAATEAFFEDLYQRFAGADAWHLYDDVLPTLRELSARGFRLGLISNWDERLRALLGAFQLSRFFDAVSVSIEVGFAKPAPEIFRHSVALLGVTPQSVLHVGDSVVEDMQGATQAGLGALCIDRAAKGGPQVRTSRCDVPARVQRAEGTAASPSLVPRLNGAGTPQRGVPTTRTADKGDNPGEISSLADLLRLLEKSCAMDQLH